jgi:hypothetical protein
MMKPMKRRLKGRCLPGLLLVAIFLLVPQASQAQETVIVTYTASPEPLRSRLQAWISARFLLWPELMDVSSGAQVDFAAAKQIFVYGMGSESHPFQGLKKHASEQSVIDLLAAKEIGGCR